MKYTPILIKFVSLAFSLLLLAGCSGTSNSREGLIKFSGETPQYEGPGAITAGEMKMILENTSAYDLDILVLKMEAGKTWQDMLDYLGTPGSKVPPPAWVENTTSIGVPNQPEATLFILDEGSYAIILCRCNEILDYQVWPVAPLDVGSQ